VEAVRTQIRGGQWRVLRDRNQIVAGLRLLWQVEATWGEQPPVAGRLHSRPNGRPLPGRTGVGARLINWAGA
jgi:hypothetical protein